VTDGGCLGCGPFLDAFVDGELSAERVLEIEQHLVACEACHEKVQFTRAVKAATRKVALDQCAVSSCFEAQVRRSLCAERKRQRAEALEASEFGNRRELSERKHRPLPWRVVAPLAAAAAIGLVFAGAKKGENRAFVSSMIPQKTLEAADPEALLEELIQLHAAEPVEDTSDPASVLQLGRRVGLSIDHLEPAMHQYGARWVGGSVVPVKDQRAASLRYRLGGHRVTVYVYDSKRVPLRGTQSLEPRVVRDRPVFVGTRRGYSIAAMEQKGVGYAIATDLDTHESAELVASIK
jgi:anti-sigma factor RsiW